MVFRENDSVIVSTDSPRRCGEAVVVLVMDTDQLKVRNKETGKVYLVDTNECKKVRANTVTETRKVVVAAPIAKRAPMVDADDVPVAKRGPGRPPKIAASVAPVVVKRGPGHPPKIAAPVAVAPNKASARKVHVEEVAPVRRGPGRPPKAAVIEEVAPVAKRGPGRPPKVSLPVAAEPVRRGRKPAAEKAPRALNANDVMSAAYLALDELAASFAARPTEKLVNKMADAVADRLRETFGLA